MGDKKYKYISVRPRITLVETCHGWHINLMDGDTELFHDFIDGDNIEKALEIIKIIHKVVREITFKEKYHIIKMEKK